jgi:hypothetical protein
MKCIQFRNHKETIYAQTLFPMQIYQISNVLNSLSCHIPYVISEDLCTGIAYIIQKTKLCGLNPQANYTGRSTAAFRRS